MGGDLKIWRTLIEMTEELLALSAVSSRVFVTIL
jgi:hypothetical protein